MGHTVLVRGLMPFIPLGVNPWGSMELLTQGPNQEISPYTGPMVSESSDVAKGADGSGVVAAGLYFL